jgi:Lon protease-like protein
MEIPLFPLHTVLAPGIALPLHVFEPRYRALVRHCLDASTPFGVVLIREGSEVLRPGEDDQELSISAVGTLAEIREASRFADGRWRLLVVGDRRFVVRDVHPDREVYLVADVDLLEDEVGDATAAGALVRRVTRRFVDYLRLLQPRDGEAAEPIDVQVEVEVEVPGDAAAETTGGGPADLAAALGIPDDPSTLSFLLTGIVQVEPDRRQELLEAVTAEERLRELDALLDRELLLLARRLAPFTPGRSSEADGRN